MTEVNHVHHLVRRLRPTQASDEVECATCAARWVPMSRLDDARKALADADAELRIARGMLQAAGILSLSSEESFTVLAALSSVAFGLHADNRRIAAKRPAEPAELELMGLNNEQLSLIASIVRKLLPHANDEKGVK